MTSKLTSLKQLSSAEGRKAYYKYNLADPKTLFHHVEPHLDPSFNKELLDRYGADAHDDPRFRFVWAGTLRETNYHFVDGRTIAYDGMKYEFMKIRTVQGYTYFDASGTPKTVPTRELVPKGKLGLETTKLEGLGVMKFALEAKYSYDEMVEQGYYPKAGTKEALNWCYREGNRYRIEPNPRGEYRLCFMVEDSDGGFRDVTRADLEQVHLLINRARNESPQELVERRQKEIALMIATQSKEEQERFSKHFEDAMISAEKEVIRGRVLYSK